MYVWRWLLVSLLSALAAMAVFAVALLLPFWWATAVLAVGVTTFLCVLWLNPDFWYRRAAASIIGVWLASCIAAGVNVHILFDETIFGYWVIDNLGWPWHLSSFRCLFSTT